VGGEKEGKELVTNARKPGRKTWNPLWEHVGFRAVTRDFRALSFGTGEGRYSKIGLKKKEGEILEWLMRKHGSRTFLHGSS
jgi:hypothetical protein